MFRLGINLDEISDSMETAIEVMLNTQIKYGELRTVNKNNFAFWDELEIKKVKTLLSDNGIKPIAVATPLFKWYEDASSPDVEHDNFGFNPSLSDDEKKQVIKKVISNAKELSIPRLRIFSRLGTSLQPVKSFLSDPLLKYALDIADENNVDLCLENEPVCQIHTKKDIIELFTKNTHPRLKLWLDIANIIDAGEIVDARFIQATAKYIQYVHAKDFIYNDGTRQYVPIGEGIIDYHKILRQLSRFTPEKKDLFITIETHAPDNMKIDNSVKSLTSMKLILNRINNGN